MTQTKKEEEANRGKIGSTDDIGLTYDQEQDIKRTFD